MSNPNNHGRAITRSLSKGRLSEGVGLDQPSTEDSTTHMEETLNTTTIEPISNSNLLFQVQQLIQQGQLEIKNTMENMHSTIGMNGHIMQAQLEEVDRRMTKLEETNNDRVEELMNIITHPERRRMSDANDPIGLYYTREVADAGEVTEEDPIDLNPNKISTSEVYSKPRAKGKYSKDGEVLPDTTPGQDKRRKETKHDTQRSARMRASTSGKTKTHSKNRRDPGDSSSSSDSESGKERKTASTSKYPGKEDVDHAHSEDDSVLFVPTKFRNLKNMRINNPELKEVLSYETYRLVDQTQTVSIKIRKELAKIAGRMKAHIPDDQKFTGNDPVAVIRFLEEFKSACDDNGLSEGAALYLFQYFLLDPAKKSVRLFMRTNANNIDQHSYSGVVLFLLTSYAPEEEVSTERRKIFLHQQKSTEGEVDFAVRLQEQASRLGRAFRESELITSYLNGLPENIRTYVSAVHPNATTFIQTQMAAQKAGRTLKIKSTTLSTITTLPPARRPARLPAPNYVYQPSKEAPINNLRVNKKKECFVCGQDHYLHECPTLNEDQRKHAVTAHEKFVQIRQQKDMLRNYTGNTFNGRNNPNYAMSSDAMKGQVIETPEMPLEESSENE
jgi:hypothetical protein